MLLEEYLLHRSALLPADQPDPGTLFLTNAGNAMDCSTIRDRIEELPSRYVGVAVSPHLFRDIVAYEWLKAHPEDFLTLSKLLFIMEHKDVCRETERRVILRGDRRILARKDTCGFTQPFCCYSLVMQFV